MTLIGYINTLYWPAPLHSMVVASHIDDTGKIGVRLFFDQLESGFIWFDNVQVPTGTDRSAVRAQITALAQDMLAPAIRDLVAERDHRVAVLVVQ
jgi:hypothetical protein